MKFKQIKKIWVEGFSTHFFYLLKKRKKCLKKAEHFGAIFLASSFAQKHTQKMVFIWTLNKYHLLILTISWY